MKTGLKSLLIAGLLANAALVAHAQTSPMAAATDHRMRQNDTGREHSMHGSMDPVKMEEKAAKRLGELKTKLKITPAQEGDWSTFAAAMKPPARMEHNRPDPAEMAKLTTPERIDKMRPLRAQHMAEMQAHMTQREEATKMLYANLNADQKKILDAAHSTMMQRWGEHKGMGHGQRH